MTKLTDLQREAHAIAKDHGWWDEERAFNDLIGLVHDKLSEANAAYREKDKWDNWRELHTELNGKPIGVASELADAVIRVADMAEHYGARLSVPSSFPQMDTFGEGITHIHYYVNLAGQKHWEDDYRWSTTNLGHIDMEVKLYELPR